MFIRTKTLLLLGMLLLTGCYSETFVVFPQWDVLPKDRSGAVLTGVSLHAYAWSQPHSRLDAEATYRSSATGHISAAERLDSKITAPFVLHGVSYSYLSFCVSAPGYRTLIGTLADLEPGRPLTFTLPLSPGESFAVCDDFGEFALAGASGATISRLKTARSEACMRSLATRAPAVKPLPSRL